MKPENVELHIEELVLRGFAPGDRYRIGEAVERELAHLFSEQGTPPSLAQEARLHGWTVERSRRSRVRSGSDRCSGGAGGV